MKIRVGAFEAGVVGHPQQRAREQPVERAVTGELVVLAPVIKRTTACSRRGPAL
jgi:hypothetical protein